MPFWLTKSFVGMLYFQLAGETCNAKRKSIQWHVEAKVLLMQEKRQASVKSQSCDLKNAMEFAK